MSFIGNRSKGLMAIGVLALIQSVFRFLVLGVALTGGWVNLENYVSPEAGAVMDVIFLFLGAGGIVLTYGLLSGKKWGYTGTIGISAFTIVFDIWAIFVVQPSAVLGVILPVVFIVYLVLIKDKYCSGVKADEFVGGVRN